MQNNTKLITFVVVIAILVVLIIVGYNNYQSTRSGGLPYATSTQEELSTSDTTTAIESELNAETEPEIESDLKDLEQESSGL